METLIISIVSVLIFSTILYFIIVSAIRKAISEPLHKTNALLMKLLDSNGVNHANIETRTEKLQRIESGQKQLFSELSEGKIDKKTYDVEYNKLGLQRNEL